jgi:glycosyltransferase involved in cell wall biosynthesis
MSKKGIILSVISDLYTDQRIIKIATTLQQHVGDVTVICRRTTNSFPVEFPFKVKRIKTLLHKGILFYVEFNLRLLLQLFVTKGRIFVANDMDTLLPNYIATNCKRALLAFDSHEIMSQVPEVVNRKNRQKIWQWLEKKLIPHTTIRYTVCNSLANYYKQTIGVDFHVVRNVPYRIKNELPKNSVKKIILYQGSINMGRGLELMLETMKYTDNTTLVIAGDGYLLPNIKNLARLYKVNGKVVFTGRLTPDELRKVTVTASLGLSIEENMGLNYYYALPNKLFDYIQARIPVLVSDLPEMAAIVRDYNIGEVVVSRNAEAIAQQITGMLNDSVLQIQWSKNLEKAAAELTWENDSTVLVEMFGKHY